MKSYPKLNTIVITFITLGVMILTPLTAYGQSSTPIPSPTTQTKQGTNNAARIAAIKSKAEAEIDKRLASLNAAASKINAATKLSASNKSNFSSQIQTNLTNLTSLRAKIDADADLATLKADAQSIYTNFRIYAVFLPQVHELSTVDIMGVTADNLTTIVAKLQTRIQTAQSKKKDVSQLQNLLSDMQSKIADAKTQYQAVESEIAPLTAASYPGSTATLQDGRSKIKTGADDLKAAWQDAKQIRDGLKTLGGSKTPPASSSAAPTK